MLHDMGLSLILHDGGWRFVEQGYRDVARLSVIRIVLFTVAVAAATCLAVYLFIGRRKNDYAVMRAMGTTKRRAGESLVYPLMATALVSVLLGSGAAYLQTLRTIESSNVFVALEQHAVDTSIPASVIVGSVLGQLVITLGIALAMLRRIGNLPPLVLLCGAETAGGKRTKAVFEVLKRPEHARAGGHETSAALMSEAAVGYMAHDTLRRGHAMEAAADVRSPERREEFLTQARFALRYIRKHIRRSVVKSAIAVALAALLCFAIGWISELRVSYASLLADTSSKVNFVGQIPPNLIQRLAFPTYVSGTYYEGLSNPVSLRFGGMAVESVVMTVTSDVDRYYGRNADITLADFAVYTESLTGSPIMESPGNVLILGRGIADTLGVGPGGTVAITPTGAEDRTFVYRIAGVAGDRNDMQVFAAISDEPMLFNPVEALEISLEDGGLAGDYHAYAREWLEGGVTTIVNSPASVENLRNALRLTEMLYPMAVVAALFIGGFLCCLAILQLSVEAAILRILGTTRGKTRVLLTGEQALLCITGLIAGMLAMLIYRGFAIGALSGQMNLFAALYFSMIIACGAVCSSLVTRRPPLELLQVRE
jgi:hypothetical protein